MFTEFTIRKGKHWDHKLAQVIRGRYVEQLGVTGELAKQTDWTRRGYMKAKSAGMEALIRKSLFICARAFIRTTLKSTWLVVPRP